MAAKGRLGPCARVNIMSFINKCNCVGAMKAMEGAPATGLANSQAGHESLVAVVEDTAKAVRVLDVVHGGSFKSEAQVRR